MNLRRRRKVKNDTTPYTPTQSRYGGRLRTAGLPGDYRGKSQLAYPRRRGGRRRPYSGSQWLGLPFGRLLGWLSGAGPRSYSGRAESGLNSFSQSRRRRGGLAYAVVFAFLKDLASLLFGSTPRVEVPHYAVGLDAVEAVAWRCELCPVVSQFVLEFRNDRVYFFHARPASCGDFLDSSEVQCFFDPFLRRQEHVFVQSCLPYWVLAVLQS